MSRAKEDDDDYEKEEAEERTMPEIRESGSLAS